MMLVLGTCKEDLGKEYNVFLEVTGENICRFIRSKVDLYT